MNRKYYFLNTKDLVFALNEHQIILYPTESVYGLGCDPDSEHAVNKLLQLKKRPWSKGLILVAAYYEQLLGYIDDSSLDHIQRSRVFSTWPGPITWVFPVHFTIPKWLTGRFSSLAVRLSAFKPIQKLCLSFGKPIVSTSANLSGCPEAYSINDVFYQLSSRLFIMDHDDSKIRISGPTEIRDAITGKTIRQHNE